MGFEIVPREMLVCFVYCKMNVNALGIMICLVFFRCCYIYIDNPICKKLLNNVILAHLGSPHILPSKTYLCGIAPKISETHSSNVSMFSVQNVEDN